MCNDCKLFAEFMCTTSTPTVYAKHVQYAYVHKPAYLRRLLVQAERKYQRLSIQYGVRCGRRGMLGERIYVCRIILICEPDAMLGKHAACSSIMYLWCWNDVRSNGNLIIDGNGDDDDDDDDIDESVCASHKRRTPATFGEAP